jgi:hypothetical protein
MLYELVLIVGHSIVEYYHKVYIAAWRCPQSIHTTSCGWYGDFSLKQVWRILWVGLVKHILNSLNDMISNLEVWLRNLLLCIDLLHHLLSLVQSCNSLVRIKAIQSKYHMRSPHLLILLDLLAKNALFIPLQVFARLDQKVCLLAGWRCGEVLLVLILELVARIWAQNLNVVHISKVLVTIRVIIPLHPPNHILFLLLFIGGLLIELELESVWVTLAICIIAVTRQHMLASSRLGAHFGPLVAQVTQESLVTKVCLDVTLFLSDWLLVQKSICLLLQSLNVVLVKQSRAIQLLN